MSREKLDHDTRELYAEMKPLGWSLEKTNGGHYRWTHTSGAFVFSSSTSSDHRAMLNTRKQLERELRKFNPPAPEKPMAPINPPPAPRYSPPPAALKPVQTPAPAVTAPVTVTGLREAALALRDLCDSECVIRVVLEKANGKWTLKTEREVITVTIAAETGEL